MESGSSAGAGAVWVEGVAAFEADFEVLVFFDSCLSALLAAFLASFLAAPFEILGSVWFSAGSAIPTLFILETGAEVPSASAILAVIAGSGGISLFVSASMLAGRVTQLLNQH